VSTAPDTTPASADTLPFFVDGVPAIDLSIQSPNLVVQGRFDRWVPIALDEGDSEGGEGGIHIFVDVTGAARNDNAMAGDPLFSLTSHSAKKLQPLTYRIAGTIKKGDVEARIEFVLQNPVPHAPFVLLNLPIDRKLFPELWNELSALVAARAEHRGAVSPRTWTWMPTLAAA
jgi:hypothetical protein